ncbi:hypothetical protein [Longimicrobium sp.]|uniref:hypothetical protein n=1 Tax=Longimicrobium sp. TaxID=2029185 RepID=UPI002EDB293E
MRTMLERAHARDLGAVPAGGHSAPLVRVAVLHHQLLPVSTREEIKPFESFTNLELLRQFLVENGFSIVLHGHKHAPFTYTDYVPSHARPDDPPRQVRVISGPAPSGPTLDPDDICRLLQFDANACTLEVERIPLVLPGQPAREGGRNTVPFTPPGAATYVQTPNGLVFDGQDVGSVYARLVASLDAANRDVENVLCQIRVSPEQSELSSLYRGFEVGDAPIELALGDDENDHELGAAKRLERFREVVDFWQRSEPTGGAAPQAFTHGTRILRYNGYMDQLHEIADALRKDPSTTRAVLVLLQPGADNVSSMSHPFPSFCLAQFLIRHPGDGSPPALDCVAYFRKLEVKYWWLVNVAEISSLQRRLATLVLAGADQRVLPDLRAGRITTFAARAHAGASPPKVQVKRIDWFYAVARERLFAMVGALVWPDMPERASLANDWMDVLRDLIPAPAPDRDGVAVAVDGLQYVVQELEKHFPAEAEQGDPELRALAASVRALLYENDRYVNDQTRGRVDHARHTEWRAEVTRIVQNMVEHTYARINRVHNAPDDQLLP